MITPAGLRAEPAPAADVISVGRVLWRRLALVVPALVLTAALAWYLPKSYQRPFEARASVLLIDPTATTTAGGKAVNPFLVDHDALLTTADILATAIDADLEHARERGEGVASLVDVKVASKPPEPLIGIVVTAGEEEDASRDIDLVLAEAQRRLRALQNDGEVNSSLYVTTLSIEHTAPRQAESGRLRPTLGIVVLGTSLTIWVALVLERRRRRGLP